MNYAERNPYSTYIQYGSIYSCDDCIVEEPAVLVSSLSGLCKYGNKAMVRKTYEDRLALSKVVDSDNQYLLVELDCFNLKNEHISALLNRLISLSSSSYEYMIGLSKMSEDNIIETLDQLVPYWCIIKE